MTERIGGVSGGFSAGVMDDDFGAGALGDAGEAGTVAELATELSTDTADLSALSGTVGSASVSASSAPARPATARIAEAYVRDGWSGVDALLDTDPALVRDLVGSNRDAMQGTIETAILAARGSSIPVLSSMRAAWGADAIMDHVAERFGSMAREAVRRETVGGIDRLLTALESASPEEIATHLSSAPPGSAVRVVADRIGAHGRGTEPWRVGEYLEAATDELRELRGVVMGGTWSPDEFPGSTARVESRMGLEGAMDGSIAAAAFERDAYELATVAAYGEMFVDAVLNLHEASVAAGYVSAATTAAPLAAAEAEAAALAAGFGADVAAAVGAEAFVGTGTGAVAAAAAVPLFIGVVAVGFGVLLHHQIDENRAERRDMARALGL